MAGEGTHRVAPHISFASICYVVVQDRVQTSRRLPPFPMRRLLVRADLLVSFTGPSYLSDADSA